jgi:malonate transporter
MAGMGGVLAGFSLVAVVIGVGYVAARLRIGGPNAVQALTQTAFSITNPALLFTVLAKANLADVFSAYVPVALISAVLTAGLYVLVSRLWFPRAVAETAIGAMSSSYVNANNIGIPIAVYALGNATPVAPILLVQLLLLAPMYLTILDVATGGRPSLRTIASQPFRNPMIIASFAGVVVAAIGAQVPALIWQPLQLLGGAAVPLVLMAFGMSLHGSRLLAAPAEKAEVLTGTILKSVVMPVLTFLTARVLFGLSGPLLLGAVMMAGLPSAQNAFLFASRYNRGMPVARGIILLTTVLAVPVLVAAAALLA